MGPFDAEISELSLDLKNPRIVGANSQREALHKIIEDQQDKLLVLARSIVDDEGMNPMDRFLVLRDGKDLIVLEGNRRLVALKILATPSVLNDITITSSLRKAFDKLAPRFDRSSVEPLACFEVRAREDGVKWIQQRHTGENGGKGVVPWSGLATSRFRGQNPALQALAFVEAHGKLSDSQKAQLEQGFPITTLERLLSSRDLRSRLGFDVKNGKLLSGLPPEELLKPLRQIVLDLAERRVNVSNLKNKTQQNEYVDKISKTSVPDLSTGTTVRPVEEIAARDFSAPPSPTKAPKRVIRKKDETDRRTLIPKRLALGISRRRMASIFDGLKSLLVDEAPKAIAVLFRVFLELSIDHFMNENGIPLRETVKGGHEKDKSLRSKVIEVVDHLVGAGDDRKSYRSVQRSIDTVHSPLSIDLLNDYVHNRFTTPKSRDLLAAWDDAQHLFEKLWA